MSHSTIKADSAKTVETQVADPGAPKSASAEDHAQAQPRIPDEDRYLVVIPSSGASGTLVNQVKHTVFHYPGDQALHAVKETYLRRIEWVLIFSRHNLTTSPEEHTVKSLTRLTVANGKEASVEVGLSASFKGLGVSFGASSRTFTSDETVAERSHETKYTIQPGKSLYVYQRHYTFNDRIWWILDAWNDLWTVGANVTYATVTANIGVTIQADEVLSSDAPLSGQLSVNVREGTRTEYEARQIFRQFTNITQKAKDSINRTLASANKPN